MRVDISDAKALQTAVGKYLDDFPGDLMCALQLWYEGLGGMGTPTTAEMTKLNEALAAAKGWADAGDVRYEKFGVQKSVKKMK